MQTNLCVVLSFEYFLHWNLGQGTGRRINLELFTVIETEPLTGLCIIPEVTASPNPSNTPLSFDELPHLYSLFTHL